MVEDVFAKIKRTRTESFPQVRTKIRVCKRKNE